MFLLNRNKGTCFEDFNEYVCELTIDLDLLAGIKSEDEYYTRNHYIVADDICKNFKCLLIGFRGEVVGEIIIDDSNTIISLSVDTDCVVKTYRRDVNEKIQRYIGQVIEL